MAIDQQKLMQAIHDTIYDALTSAPPVGGGIPIEPRQQTFLTLAFPGNPIDIAQFANPWSPNNPQGSITASENFSLFTDIIPDLSTLFNPSGTSIEQIYGDEILNAAVDPTTPDPAQQQEYERAYNFLFIDGIDYDENGSPVTVKVKSPAYRNYENKKAAYSAALMSYLSNYLQYDLSNPADQRRWAILAPTLQTPVDLAYSEFQSARPGVVESAVATVGQFQASSRAAIFQAARQRFVTTRLARTAVPNQFWHWVDAFPANWFAESAADNFTQLTITSRRLRINESSHFSSYSGGASAGWGLWSVGGGSSGSFQHHQSSTESENIQVSFKFGRVELRRGWFTESLMSLDGWRVAGRSPGAYSTGTIAGNQGIFPLLATTFIVARDIQISGTWGRTDAEFAARSTSHSASVGWGPFRLSGSYSSSSSSRTFKSDFDGTTIKTPGIQVIAWVNRIQPYSPPPRSYAAGQGPTMVCVPAGNPFWGETRIPDSGSEGPVQGLPAPVCQGHFPGEYFSVPPAQLTAEEMIDQASYSEWVFGESMSSQSMPPHHVGIAPSYPAAGPSQQGHQGYGKTQQPGMNQQGPQHPGPVQAPNPSPRGAGSPGSHSPASPQQPHTHGQSMSSQQGVEQGPQQNVGPGKSETRQSS